MNIEVFTPGDKLKYIKTKYNIKQHELSRNDISMIWYLSIQLLHELKLFLISLFKIIYQVKIYYLFLKNNAHTIEILLENSFIY